jgi:cation diffusion facilitator CzcD-associated flavoprotein CzcO
VNYLVSQMSLARLCQIVSAIMPSPPSSTSSADGATSASSVDAIDYDVIIVGAGMSGLCQLYHLRNLGLSVKVYDDAADVGGTWFWNRYPGCRFDSESETYAYSFSQELLDEWHWKEHFSSQPENLKYCQYVANKFDVYKHIQFSTRVSSAHWQEESRTWKLTTATGEQATCRFFVTADGPLSTPTMPRNLDAAKFKGESCHTAKWPHTPVSFEGKRVAVIGTGATGVQTIQEVVKTAKHLTVFQRTPNWCCPLHNSPITEEEMAQIRKNYAAIFKICNESFACFVHQADPRSVFDVSQEEREALWEKLYAEPGFGIWMGNFRDLLVDQKANDLISDWIANKIRSRVKDPVTAEKLIPKNHGFGTRRLPLETFYYEAYNQPHVELVDLHETPIESITEKGIQTSDQEREFDTIIYATGFDALTGSFNRIDIRGVGGERLKDRWAKSPHTYLGIMVDNYPNMLMIMGPHTALGNIVRSVEYGVSWITRLLSFAQEKHLTRLEATKEGVDEWTEHVNDLGKNMLSAGVDSWMSGVNHNVEGKSVRHVARYAGSSVAFRVRADKVADDGYKELLLA